MSKRKKRNQKSSWSQLYCAEEKTAFKQNPEQNLSMKQSQKQHPDLSPLAIWSQLCIYFKAINRLSFTPGEDDTDQLPAEHMFSQGDRFTWSIDPSPGVLCSQSLAFAKQLAGVAVQPTTMKRSPNARSQRITLLVFWNWDPRASMQRDKPLEESGWQQRKETAALQEAEGGQSRTERPRATEAQP